MLGPGDNEVPATEIVAPASAVTAFTTAVVVLAGKVIAYSAALASTPFTNKPERSLLDDLALTTVTVYGFLSPFAAVTTTDTVLFPSLKPVFPETATVAPKAAASAVAVTGTEVVELPTFTVAPSKATAESSTLNSYNEVLLESGVT